jgi:hypothetical protein
MRTASLSAKKYVVPCALPLGSFGGLARLGASEFVIVPLRPFVLPDDQMISYEAPAQKPLGHCVKAWSSMALLAVPPWPSRTTD